MEEKQIFESFNAVAWTVASFVQKRDKNQDR